MHKRCLVILKHIEGFTNKTIAEMEDVESHAGVNYIKNYELSGLAGVEMKYSPGLNLIEGLLKWAKSSVVSNVFC